MRLVTRGNCSSFVISDVTIALNNFILSGLLRFAKTQDVTGQKTIMMGHGDMRTKMRRIHSMCDALYVGKYLLNGGQNEVNQECVKIATEKRALKKSSKSFKGTLMGLFDAGDVTCLNGKMGLNGRWRTEVWYHVTCDGLLWANLLG